MKAEEAKKLTKSANENVDEAIYQKVIFKITDAAKKGKTVLT